MKQNGNSARVVSARRQDESAPGKGIRLPRYLAGILALVAVTPWVLLSLGLLNQHASKKKHLAAGLAASDYGVTVLGDPGPWGKLELTRINIEPPSAFIDDYVRFAPARWTFANTTPRQLEAILEAAKLTPSQRTAILAAAVEDPSVLGQVVTPSTDIIMGLSKEARAKIYLELSRSPQNRRQIEPFRFRAQYEDQWFADSGIAPETQALLHRLIYYRGKTALFSDLGVVMDTLRTPEQRKLVIKTLSRQSTLLMGLRLDKDSNIPALLDYWGGSRRAKDIRPILESLSKVPEGETLDVVHLLPQFARKRLYTYPDPGRDKIAEGYDCHWTSMNFWNDMPDDKFVEDSVVSQTLQTAYNRVNPPYAFGDVLMFFHTGNDAIHSCVYIADDIVFTKNGSSPTNPWILMKLENLRLHYEAVADVAIRGYRMKEPALDGN